MSDDIRDSILRRGILGNQDNIAKAFSVDEDELEKAKRRTYEVGEISPNTGLQKQPDGSWAPPKKGVKKKQKEEEKKGKKGFEEVNLASGEYELKQGDKIKVSGRSVTGRKVSKDADILSDDSYLDGSKSSLGENSGTLEVINAGYNPDTGDGVVKVKTTDGKIYAIESSELGHPSTKTEVKSSSADEGEDGFSHTVANATVSYLDELRKKYDVENTDDFENFKDKETGEVIAQRKIGSSDVRHDGALSKESSKEDFGDSKEYQREEFTPVPPPKEGDAYTVMNPKSGYYNERKIQKIEGDTATVYAIKRDIIDKRAMQVGDSYEVSIDKIHDAMNKHAREKHEEEQDFKEAVHNLSVDIGLDEFEGGNILKKYDEFGQVMKNLYDAVQEFATGDRELGGMYYGGTELRQSQSGTPLTLVFNDIHRSGRYGVDKPFLIQAQVGGAIPLEQRRIIKTVLNDVMSKLEFSSSYGKAYTSETTGTNWESVMLVAPQENNRRNILPEQIVDSIYEKLTS